MKKYFGWIFVLMTSLTMVSAYAADQVTEDNDDEIAVIIEDDDLDDQGEE